MVKSCKGAVRNKYVGLIYETTNCGDVEVVEYIDRDNIHIMFLDTKHQTIVSLGNLKKGSVQDWSLPSVCGVGYKDCGKDVNGEHRKVSVVWMSVLQRCYDEKSRNKHPSYIGCTVSENFKYFSKFKDWVYGQVGHDQDGWQLDKDILVKGNKIYSENTCCFVPREINTLFVKSNKIRGQYPIGVSFCKSRNRFVASMRKYGKRACLGYFKTPEEAFYAYKEAKEAYIKDVANKWKDQIDIKVYNALMNYEVDIDD